MSDIAKRLLDDLKGAMKAQDKLRTSVLRMTKAELNKIEIDGGTLDDAGVIAILRKEIKRREEAAEAFGAGGRADQADKERAEAKILAEYLPAELSDDEIEAMVREAAAEAGAVSPRDIGKIMKPVLTRAAGRTDGKRVQQIALRVLTS
ncbi:GatB/YqeY domain-containing protein [bacterium]|nr:GatB/YqeY domain-containing protein [bacterium]